jgi:hypothetical protein
MIEVREILRRVAQGLGARPIAAAVGIDRKTVTRYVNAAREAGVTHDTELTDDVVHDVARRKAPAGLAFAHEPASQSTESAALGLGFPVGRLVGCHQFIEYGSARVNGAICASNRSPLAVTIW